MTLDNPTSLVSTSDVGSHFEGHLGLLKTLSAAQRRGVVVDAGGFFGNTGYNQLGRGEVERGILAELYDLCLPTAPGLAHYLGDPVLREKSVCANLTRLDGAPVFRPSRRVRVVGIDTLVLGVIGEEEFEAIPVTERGAMRWHPPARCIRLFAQAFARRPNPTRRSAIVVVSRSGTTATDVELAKVCPEVNVIVSSSGHPNEQTVNRVGTATVVNSAGGGAGYAVIQPGGAGWEAATKAFPADVRGRPREALRPLHARIDGLTQTLREPVGGLRPEYQNRTLSPAPLLTSIAREMLRAVGVDQVVLAADLVHPTPLGSTLTRGQLLECAGRGEDLVAIELDVSSAARLHASLAPGLARFVVLGQLPRHRTARIATSASIAARIGAPVTTILGPVSEYAAKVLTCREADAAAPMGARPKRIPALPTSGLVAAGPTA